MQTNRNSYKKRVLAAVILSLLIVMLLAACGDSTATQVPPAAKTSTPVPPTATTEPTTAPTSAPATQIPADTTASLGAPFKVKAGQPVTIKDEGLEVSFNKVVSDSRCPANVNCVWSGEITIEIGLKQDKGGNDSILLALPGVSQTKSSVITGGYSVKFVGAEPGRLVDSKKNFDVIPVQLEEYVVTLEITKA